MTYLIIFLLSLFVTSGQIYTLSRDATYSSVTVYPGGELRFDPSVSVTLTSTGNIVISGTLTMQPSASNIVHRIHFDGVTETNFVGGGMDVKSTDVGLWVMGAGKLDIVGASKTAWTNAAGSIPTGASVITLTAVPMGWQVGDQISIVPTQSIAYYSFYTHFELRTITAINGATLTLNTPLSYPHPANSGYTAEILNLTRNVRIDGSGDGTASPVTNHRAHVFIHSTVPQTIRYVAIRYMGPRKVSGGTTVSVLGRYGLHFHMSGDGSRGSLVEGVVVRDSGGHAFVPHASDGIVLNDTISYNTYDDAYWWDAPACSDCELTGAPDINDTHDLTITHAVAAKVLTDPTYQGYRLAGFTLRRGSNLNLFNSVAVGVTGNSDATGFGWPEQGQASWNFDGNLAHDNARNGIFVWQNTTAIHVVTNYVGYNNGFAGIDQGAYQNAYHYSGLVLFGNGFDLNSRATSNGHDRADGYGQSFEAMQAGTVRVGEHTLGGSAVLIKNCTVDHVIVDEIVHTTAGKVDFVRCTKSDGTPLSPADFNLARAVATSVFRIQEPDGTTYKLLGNGTLTTIAPFYTYLSPLAQTVKDILDAYPDVRQELIDAGVIAP